MRLVALGGRVVTSGLLDDGEATMNDFTEKQRGVIVDLARSYYRHEINNPHLPQKAQDELREQYVMSILTGLTDPEYWG